jgi:hypothetical protein
MPPESALARVSERTLAGGACLHVVRVDGARPVPHRTEFNAAGFLARIAFRLDRALAPLSQARYRIVYGPNTRCNLPHVPDRTDSTAWPEAGGQLMRSRNGDFETGGAKLSGWQLFRGAIETENPYAGKRCVRLEYDGEDDQPTKARLTSDPFPLLPNCRYTLRFQARGQKRTQDGSMPVASLTFLDAEQRTVKAKPYRLLFAEKRIRDTWVLHSHSEATPPETRFGRITISMWRTSGTLWIDDVEVLEPVSARIAPPSVRIGRAAAGAQ